MFAHDGSFDRFVREALRGMDELRTDLRGPHADALQRLSKATHWSFGDFVASMVSGHLTGQFCSGTPKRIDFGASFLASCTRRADRGHREGIEYGFMGFVNLLSQRTLIGKTCRGTSGQVLIEAEFPTEFTGDPTGFVPTFMMHVHPRAPGRSDAENYHLSGQDIVALFSARELHASIVMAPGLLLMALKTSHSPTDFPLPKIQELVESCAADTGPARDFRDLTRFTRNVCAELGLSLYALRLRPGVTEAYKVNVLG